MVDGAQPFNLVSRAQTLYHADSFFCNADANVIFM